MTVQELIAELEKYPQHQRVVVPGYEDVFEDIDSLQKLKLKSFEPAAWYYGRYDNADEGGEPAILLVRKPSVQEY